MPPGVFADTPFTVAGLAAAIRGRRFTSEALSREVLERCREMRHLHALISQDEGQLLAAARAADGALVAGAAIGPLHGVPILIKDNIDAAGYPTSAGTPGLEGVYPRTDAPAVRRLRESGALIAGKANLHELAVGGTSHNLHFGDVVNPWRAGLIPGGSSGGSAVAVAARMVPAALGTDTNGSVRGPCALQGIAGLRPSLARYPYGGTFPSTPMRDSIGTLATDMEDLVLLDQVLSAETYDLPDIALRGLRLARPDGEFCELMDGRTLSIFEEAVALLRREGAVIVSADIPGLHDLAARAAWPISAYEVVRDVPAFLAGRTAAIDIGEIVARIASPVVRQRFNPPAADPVKLEAAYHEAMEVHRPKLQRLLADHFTKHRLHALIFPTTPFPAVAVDDDTADVTIDGRTWKNGFGLAIRNTVYQSAAGIPSLTVPAGLTPDGLPVGLSFDGMHGWDVRLLAIGRAFERARGPFPLPRL
jgi:mandelamide amidase